MKRRPVFLGVLLLVSVLAACGGATSTPATSTTQTVLVRTPTPTRVTITSPLVGTYSTTITRQDVASMPDLKTSFNQIGGLHMWSFNQDGTYTWTDFGSNGGSVTGPYQVSQGALSLTDSNFDCARYAPTGTYSWVLKGNMLILQAKDDGCLIRKFVLTAHPLVRQGS